MENTEPEQGYQFQCRMGGGLQVNETDAILYNEHP